MELPWSNVVVDALCICKSTSLRMVMVSPSSSMAEMIICFSALSSPRIYTIGRNEE